MVVKLLFFFIFFVSCQTISKKKLMSGHKKLLSILLAILCPVFVWGQLRTVSGTVTDKATGEPVEFATVVLVLLTLFG